MDRNDDTSFCERFQDSCPQKVAQLREAIRKDVKETDGQILNVRTYNKYLIALPVLETFPTEFCHIFKDKYIDLDMQDDLERTDVINWCRTTKPVYPLRTTADGNCLLHAVSQGLWGIEDSELFLRRLLYVNLVTDPNGSFKRRWMFHQRNSQDLQRIDVRFNTVECNEEWESVIKATDDVARSQSHGLPYTALESIHLFVTANMLRRPVIVLADSMARTVYGETIQDSQISGIYFPLDWPPEQCNKNPVVIGYNMNHFAPLVFEDNLPSGQNDATVRAIPLVNKDMDSIPAKYLMPDEEANYANIFRDYLNATEVYYGTTSLPAAKVQLVQLPESVNIVDACRIDCERKFRRLLNPDTETTVPPFNFQTANRGQPEQQRPNTGASPAHRNTHHNQHRKRCATIGCDLYADPETQNLCSKCFKDFTIQYHRQEEAALRTKRQQQALPPQPLFGQTPAAANQGSRREIYHDMSMMGEDCYAGCGFKCSVETYPYCHECYPKFVGAGTVAQQVRMPESPRQPSQPDLSVMPETCRNCSYRCSKATYPYCHGCYPKFAIQHNAAPTAPPPSIQATGGQALPVGGMEVTSNDETAVVSSKRVIPPNRNQHLITQVSENNDQIEPMEVQIGSGALNRKCSTLQCRNLAIKGNNGYCDICYQLTLFGGGMSPSNTSKSGPTLGECSTPGCKGSVTVPETTLCLVCFLKGDKNQMLSLTGAHALNVGMNITPTSEEKILNSGPSRNRKSDRTAVYSLSGASMKSVPAEHDERMERTPVNATVAVAAQAEQQSKHHMEETRKYICATPGCDGIRTNNEQGLCYSCLKNYRSTETVSPQPPSGSNLEESAPFSSCSPVAPTKEEMKKLNPVVVSSKDKIKCASPACTELIYPPKKLCDTCSAVLEKHQAARAQEENRRTVGVAGTPCNTQGCKFFGSPYFHGYCSSCYKAQAPQTRYTAPLAHRPTYSSNTAPIIAESQKVETRLIAPILPVKAKLCIEKGCTRYGDPSQRDRCSYHFQKASELFAPMSPESIEQNRQIIAEQQQQQQQARQQVAGIRHPVVPGSGYLRTSSQEATRTNKQIGTNQIATGSSAAGLHNGSPAVDPFEVSYNRLITSKKSNNLCKNFSVTGCENYGNSSKGGYCNTCYPQIQRSSQSRPH